MGFPKAAHLRQTTQYPMFKDKCDSFLFVTGAPGFLISPLLFSLFPLPLIVFMKLPWPNPYLFSINNVNVSTSFSNS